MSDEDPSLREGGDGLCVIAPVDALQGMDLGDTGGHPKPEVMVRAAGFEQQHASRGVRRETVRQYAAGRTGAHDDVIEVCAVHSRFPSPSICAFVHKRSQYASHAAGIACARMAITVVVNGWGACRC